MLRVASKWFPCPSEPTPVSPRISCAFAQSSPFGPVVRATPGMTRSNAHVYLTFDFELSKFLQVTDPFPYQTP